MGMIRVGKTLIAVAGIALKDRVDVISMKVPIPRGGCKLFVLRVFGTLNRKMHFGFFVANMYLLKSYSIHILGTINGIRIPDDVMTTNTEQHVTGKKIFKEDVRILGNITTNNFTVNRLWIPEDLVLRGANQKIEGRKSFASPVRFRKSLYVNGLVNGKKLSDFSKRVVTLSTDQIITGKKTFLNGFTVNGNLDVNGLMDYVNLTELDFDAVRMNKNEMIKGKNLFRLNWFGLN